MSKVSVLLPDEHFETELQRREAALYQSACEVEADEGLNQEMSDWDVTIADGIMSFTDSILSKDAIRCGW